MSRVLPSSLERFSAAIYSILWIYILFRLTDYTETMFGIDDINTIFGFFPLILLWACLPILLIAHGRVLAQSAITWLLLLFSGIILYGSLATMLQGYTFQETYLRHFVIMGPALGAIAVGYNPPNERLNRFIVGAGLVASYIAVCLIIFHHMVMPLRDFFHILKEEMFFTVAVFVGRLFIGDDKSRGYRTATHILGFLIVFAGIITVKFTTFFCAAFVIVCYGIRIWQQRDHVATALKGLLVVIPLIVSVAVLYPIYAPKEVPFPDGSADTRTQLYGIRWNEFMDSPFVGTFFVGEQRIILWRMVVPAHSSTLDILAKGGLLCATLYAAICILVMIACWRIGRRSVPGPFFNGYSCMALLVYLPISATFNPLYDQISMGLTYWMTVGLVTGTALRIANQPVGVAPPAMRRGLGHTGAAPGPAPWLGGATTASPPGPPRSAAE